MTAKQQNESKPNGKEEEDDFLVLAVGSLGRWQIRVVVLLSLLSIPCTWHISCITFQAEMTDYWCAKPENLASIPLSMWRTKSHGPPVVRGAKDDPCRIWDVDYEALTPDEFAKSDFSSGNYSLRHCRKWNYDEAEGKETIVSEWNLICDRQDMKLYAEMSFLIGIAVGGLISGFLSDKFGRKTLLMTSICLQLVFGFVVGVVRVLEVFIVARLLLGVVSCSVVFCGFVLSMEITGSKWRTAAGIAYFLPVPIGYISIAGIAYVARQWQELQLAISLPSILAVSYFWLIPESPRWALAVKDTKRAVKILDHAARVNGTELPQNIDGILQQVASESEKDSGTCADIVRNRHLRRISIAMIFIWYSVYFVYFGVVLNMGNLGGDIYINTVLSGLVEIPSILFALIAMQKLGRKWPLSATNVASGVFCLLTLLFAHKSEWINIALIMAAKFTISCGNVIMPIYTAELYPTVVRNVGMGFSNFFAGVALILVPYTLDLKRLSSYYPMGLVGASGIIGGVAVLFLKETANHPLAEYVK